MIRPFKSFHPWKIFSVKTDNSLNNSFLTLSSRYFTVDRNYNLWLIHVGSFQWYIWTNSWNWSELYLLQIQWTSSGRLHCRYKLHFNYIWFMDHSFFLRWIHSFWWIVWTSSHNWSELNRPLQGDSNADKKYISIMFHLWIIDSFEMDLFCESFEPVHMTGLNWIDPFK